MVRMQSMNAAATLPLGESGPKGPERVIRFANNLPSWSTPHPAAIASMCAIIKRLALILD